MLVCCIITLLLDVDLRHRTRTESLGCTLGSIFTHSHGQEEPNKQHTPEHLAHSPPIYPSQTRRTWISSYAYTVIKPVLSSYAFLCCVRPSEGVGVCCVFMLLWFPTEKLELICVLLQGEAAVAWPLAAFQMTSNPHSYRELKQLM